MESRSQNRHTPSIRRSRDLAVRRYRRRRAIPSSAPAEPALPAAPAQSQPQNSRVAVIIWGILLVLLILAAVGLGTGIWLATQGGGSLPAFAPSTGDNQDTLPSGAILEVEDAEEETAIAAYDTEGESFTLTLLDWSDMGELSYEDVYTQCITSVVSLTVSLKDGYSTGTGIILSADGYILTNEHVISGGSSATVQTYDDQYFDAQLVGYDTQTDLAVLKIESAGLQAASFGDSDLLAVGQAVLAIGDPMGPDLRGSMTDGIISAVNRSVTTDGITMTLLQTTAPLNSGNSGGPLINTYGLVIGVNNMKMSNDPGDTTTATVEGLGFAIPSRTVKSTVESLIQFGEVQHPALGITCYAVSAGTDDAFITGVMVDSVTTGSGAQAAGLLSGDIITGIEGQKITTVAEIKTVLDGCRVGDFVTLTIWRAGEYLELDVELMNQNDM